MVPKMDELYISYSTITMILVGANWVREVLVEHMSYLVTCLSLDIARSKQEWRYSHLRRDTLLRVIVVRKIFGCNIN